MVAGERSGDLYGAELATELKTQLDSLDVFGCGGDAMRQAGVETTVDSHQFAMVGITEIVSGMPRAYRAFRALLADVDRRRPQLAVLIDSPSLNLRLAKRLKQRRIPVIYFISPQLWAWKKWRMRHVRERVDKMLCIFDFEERIYRKAGVPAEYVGHPLAEMMERRTRLSRAAFFSNAGLDPTTPTVALLPGSRPSELHRLLPPMVESAALLAKERPELQIVVPVAPGLERTPVEEAFAARGLRPTLVNGRAAEVVGAADVAVVASGTATLETALMLRPMVVVYRMSALSWAVGRLLVRVAFVSLVNLLSGRRLVPELLQSALKPEAVAEEVRRLWEPGAAREAQVEGLQALRTRLGSGPTASRVADEVLDVMDARAKDAGPSTPR